MVPSGPALGITGGHCDETIHAPEYKITGGSGMNGVDAIMKNP